MTKIYESFNYANEGGYYRFVSVTKGSEMINIEKCFKSVYHEFNAYVQSIVPDLKLFKVIQTYLI